MKLCYSILILFLKKLTSDILLLWVIFPRVTPVVSRCPAGLVMVLPSWFFDIKDWLLCILMVPSLFPWLLGETGLCNKVFGVADLFSGVGSPEDLLVCVLEDWGLLFVTLETSRLLLLDNGGDLFLWSWSWISFPLWTGPESWLRVILKFPWWSSGITWVDCPVVFLDNLPSSHSARSFAMSAYYKNLAL